MVGYNKEFTKSKTFSSFFFLSIIQSRQNKMLREKKNYFFVVLWKVSVLLSSIFYKQNKCRDKQTNKMRKFFIFEFKWEICLKFFLSKVSKSIKLWNGTIFNFINRQDEFVYCSGSLVWDAGGTQLIILRDPSQLYLCSPFLLQFHLRSSNLLRHVDRNFFPGRF